MSDLTFTDAKPTGLSKGDIESLAESVSHDLGYNSDTKITDIVESLSGTICIRSSEEFTESEDASIIIYEDESFIINLPVHTPLTRDKFSIAHELGHYFLHHSENTGPIRAYRKGSSRVEWEANWFASAFLMPGDQFREIWNQFGGNLLLVAGHFGVSEAAARIRAKNLNLL